MWIYNYLQIKSLIFKNSWHTKKNHNTLFFTNMQRSADVGQVALLILAGLTHVHGVQMT